MAFHSEVGSGTDRASTTGFGNKASSDLLTKFVQFACSQHVATVAVNAGGTGYVVGDELTLTHGSAHLDARFEVTTVSGGVITGLRIVSSGAFALQATTATVGTGGSGYAVNDILQVQGGSSRMPAKFLVATLSGSAVATVTLYEGGGVYSSAPSNDAATLGVSSGFAGDDACELTLAAFQAIIGTTGLSVTGGTGSSATVDITLAETGWSVDTRDSNDFTDSYDAVGDEKQVTLKGDASGFTNKPYVHLTTLEAASGLDTRHAIEVLMSTAHNTSLTIANQPGISPSAHTTSSQFMLMPEENANDVDFWFKVTDRFIYVEANENPAANTDDGRYVWLAAGYYDRLGTESEDPFPGFVGASAITGSSNAQVGNENVSGIAEQYWSSSNIHGSRYYDASASTWRTIHNGDSVGVSSETYVMFPFGEKRNNITASNTAYQITYDEALFFDLGIISRSRASSSRILRRVPGTTPEFMLYPLVIISQATSATPGGNVSDRVVGTIPGIFWIYNDDNSTGAAITNFSEDYITIGTDRYRVFHNHVHTDRYQYIAVLEDV